MENPHAHASKEESLLRFQVVGKNVRWNNTLYCESYTEFRDQCLRDVPGPAHWPMLGLWLPPPTVPTGPVASSVHCLALCRNSSCPARGQATGWGSATHAPFEVRFQLTGHGLVGAVRPPFYKDRCGAGDPMSFSQGASWALLPPGPVRYSHPGPHSASSGGPTSKWQRNQGLWLGELVT